jgi:hypothetical protein
MEQKESLEKAENDLRGIIMRTHRHCQTYRVRIRVKGGQCFDRSFRSKTLAKKWKRDMESASRARETFESSEVDEKRQLLDLVFQNLQLKDGSFSLSVREPFLTMLDFKNRP